MYIRFGIICNIILEICNNRKIDSKPVKQEDVVNYLFRACLSGDIPKDLEEYVDAYEPKYKPDMANRIVQGKDNVNGKIVSFLQKSFIDERLELIEDYVNQASPDDETDIVFPLREVVYKILEQYKAPSFNIAPHNELMKGVNEYPLNFSELEEMYSSGNYCKLFAILLFYATAYIKNKVTSLSEDIARGVRLSEDLLNDINHGRYYEQFERKIVIVPDKDKGYLEVITATRFLSPYLKPKTFGLERFSHFFRFETEQIRSKCIMTSLVINGIDYTENVQIKDSIDETKDFIYQREFILENVPRQKFYDVTHVVKSYRTFPMYHMSYRLATPCKKYYLKLEIKGNECSKWRGGLKMFAPVKFGDNTINKHDTPPDTILQCVKIDEWIPSKSGYSVFARPKQEYWKEYIDIITD